MLEEAKKIFEKNKDIKYGWKSKKDGKYYNHISEGLSKNFSFQSNEEIEKNRIGICWETVEINRYYLQKANIPCKTYFFVVPAQSFYCHSVLVFQDKDKFYWMESSFKELIGIREYKSLKDLFYDVLDNFDKITHIKKTNFKNLKIYDYNSPNPGIGCVQFYFHCFRGKNITKDYLPKYIKLIDEKK